jgi:hypothetical protein
VTTAWSDPWITSRWSGFGKLWSQVVRGLDRPSSHHDLELKLRLDGTRLALDVTALDPGGRWLDDLDVHVRVLDADQQSHDTLLRQVGPGRYAAQMVVAPGSIIARPVATRAGRRFDGEWAILAQPYPPELAHIGENRERLDALLRHSGGARLRSPDELRQAPGRGLPRGRPLFLALDFLALALFVLDVMVRRARWEARA